MALKRFYVRAETLKGNVVAYGVYDCVGGLEGEHGRFKLADYSADVALHLANTLRDDLNAAAEGRQP